MQKFIFYLKEEVFFSSTRNKLFDMFLDAVALIILAAIKFCDWAQKIFKNL